MASKKKSNFISYELQRLELYLSQLQNYLDKNPPDLMVDRTEILQSTRGNPIIKVIASIEDQLKMFLTALEKLPKILEDINRLRKEVNDDKKEVVVRGDQNMPGFMDDDEDEQIEESSKEKKFVKKEEETFDDDSFYDEEGPKQLPAPEEPDDEEFDDD